MPKTRNEYIIIGSRHSTNDIIAESRNTLARWEEDLPILSPWGWSTTRRDRLEAMVTQLDDLHQIYLTRLGDQLSTTPAVHASFKALRTWSFQTLSVLRDHIDANEEVEKRVQALGSLPDIRSRGQMLAYANALFAIARENRDELDPEVATDAFFAQGQDTLDTLLKMSTDRSTTTETKLTSSAVQDELGGRIYILLKDLYLSARRALKAADRNERARFYVFDILAGRSYTKPAEDGPAAPATPTEPVSPFEPANPAPEVPLS